MLFTPVKAKVLNISVKPWNNVSCLNKPRFVWWFVSKYKNKFLYFILFIYSFLYFLAVYV